jgi:hypothetical protein
MLRTGNQSRAALAKLLIKHKADIELLSNDKSIGVLEIY